MCALLPNGSRRQCSARFSSRLPPGPAPGNRGDPEKQSQRCPGRHPDKPARLSVNAEKKAGFTLEERVELVRRCTARLPNLEVDVMDILLADYVRQRGACAIVKGLPFRLSPVSGNRYPSVPVPLYPHKGAALLRQRIPRMLDLFCGSGQMGIEGLSRGAASCVFVDSSRRSCETARRNLEAVGFGDRARQQARLRDRPRFAMGIPSFPHSDFLR